MASRARLDWLFRISSPAVLAQARVAADAVLRDATPEKRTSPHSRSRDVKRARANQLIAASLKALAGAGHTKASIDDDAESLRKGGCGRGRLARVTVAAWGASGSPVASMFREE